MSQEDKEKDICQTCEHYWTDFPMPLECYISHCDVLDKRPEGLKDNAMDETVPYPCLKCPFDSYKKKQS